MIDVHTHIIPNVDDGSTSLEASINLIKQEIEYGVTDIICTPHYRRHMFETSAESVNLSFFNLLEEVKNQNLNINLYLGQEIYCRSIDGFERTLKMLEEKSVLTFGNSKYILLEFSYTRDIDISEIIYMAKKRGYLPIVAHIERYEYIDSIEKVEEIISAGAMIQVNASSVIGKDGGKRKKFVNKLIASGMIDFVGSDIHESRKNYLKIAYDYVSKKISKDIANVIFNDNAAKLLESIK